MLKFCKEMQVSVGSIPSGYKIHYKGHHSPDCTIALLNPTKGLAFRYAGHQFGDYNPELGDGRSAVIKEVYNGYLLIKGGVKTPLTKPYLDGKLTLSKAIKEATKGLYLSLMNSGCRTQDVLAVGIKDKEDCRIVLHRSTPFRIGSFQYAACNYGEDTVQRMWQHIKTVVKMRDQPDEEVFDHIVTGYAELYNFWHEIGFVHGCLNTDNLSAVPEGIDYGWAYTIQDVNKDLKTPIDPYGWYSYENQDKAILFGLKQYLKCLQPLLPNYTEKNLIDTFGTKK